MSGVSTQGGASGKGGGLRVYPNGTASLVHVTVASNAVGAPGSGDPAGSSGGGGGIWTDDSVTIGNSIVASNTPNNCAAPSPSLVTNGGHNIFFGPNAPPGIPCLIVFSADPLLGPLADNGGPTQTIALGDGSSAIDIIPVAENCAAVDQRGVARPQFAACDAGAFELAPPPPPSTTQTGGDQTPTSGTQNPGAPADNGASPDRTPPVVKLLLAKQKLRKALKKGYFAFFSDNEIGSASADLFASGKDAKGAAAKRKRVAHGTLKITKSGKQKLVLKFTKKAKKAFAKRKKVTLTLLLTAKDAAGNATEKTAKVVLKR